MLKKREMYLKEADGTYIMNLNNLYYYVIVAEELNFTRAAARLHVSQQAVSSHIKKLEDEFNVTLLRRKPSLALTPVGTSFYNIAMEILQLQQKFYMDTKSLLVEEPIHLTLGLAYGRSKLFGPEIISQIGRLCPNMYLKIVEKSTTNILEQSLLLNEIDFFIGLTPIHSSQIQTTLLADERLLLIVPNTFIRELPPATQKLLSGPSPKISQHGGISITCFAEFPFLLPSKENIFRFVFNQYIDSINFLPNVIFESSQVDTLFSMAVDGMGITVYPGTLFNYQEKHLSTDVLANITVLPLSDCVHSKIVLGYNRYRQLSSSDDLFIEICQNIQYLQ